MQMRNVRTSGNALSLDELRLEYVRFLKQVLRDLQPLNRLAVDVCSLIERALSGQETSAHLTDEQAQLLIDVIHHLISMLRTISKPAHWKIVFALEQRLNALVKLYEPVVV